MIRSNFHCHNRLKLLEQSEAKVIVLAAHTSLQKSHDAAYAFQQEPNFWYLCGIEEADWKVVITADKTVLISPEVDEVHTVFSGALSAQSALDISGVDEILSLKEGVDYVRQLADMCDTVLTIMKDPYDKYYDFALNPSLEQNVAWLKGLFHEVKDCRPILAAQRAIKQPVEIKAIRKAVDVSMAAFTAVRTNIQAYHFEYEVEADFSHYFRYNAAAYHAYDPIVASDGHACTLHYSSNNDKLDDAQLLLVDIGAKLNGYAADITRTYALKELSPRQAAVHAEVETAHRAIIALLRPGLKIKAYSDSVDTIMKQALKNLRLYKSDDDYRRYFPHAISHGLGVDVHDSLGGFDTFQTGMVLTVEPGIYIAEENIGIRIEDDILITNDGHENLSGALPIFA